MIEQRQKNENRATARAPEARFAYYRRCQVFKRNGVQCKAPAETGSQICHAHAGQLATAVRRERERRAVLTEAVAEMRRRGRPEYEMADLFTSFKGIQVTTAVMARAVITGRIDCKTAGQMVVHLQTMSKLLWVYHRAHRGRQREKALTTKDTKKHEGLPQICARPKTLPLINTDDTDQKKLPTPKPLPRINRDDADRKKPSVGENLAVTFFKHRPALEPMDGGAKILQFDAMTFGGRSWAHGPPELRAA